MTTFHIRDSVYSYLSEPAVRAGVDSLAAQRLKTVAAGLEWQELPQFYHALLVANRVKIDWALTLEELWRDIWAGQLEGWQPLSVDEQNILGDVGIDIENCWREEWFGRCFRSPRSQPARGRAARGALICLQVSVAQEGIAVGFSVELAGTALRLDLSGFQYDEDVGSSWTVPVRFDSPSPDLTKLREAAAAAMSKINDSVSQASKSS